LQKIIKIYLVILTSHCGLKTVCKNQSLLFKNPNFNNLISNTNKTFKNKDDFNTFYNYLSIQKNYHYFKHNTDDLKIIKQKIALLEKHNKANEPNYFISQLNLLHSLFSQSLFEKTQNQINLINSVCSSNEDINTKLFSNCFLYQILVYIKNKEFKKAQIFIENQSKKYQQLKSKINTDKCFLIDFSIAINSFYLGNNTKSLQFFEIYLKEEMVTEFHHFLTNFLIQIIKDNYNSVASYSNPHYSKAHQLLSDKNYTELKPLIQKLDNHVLSKILHFDLIK